MTQTASARSGLILDFGGVITTDFYGAMRAYGAREGFGETAVEHALRDTEEGRTALAAVEDGSLSQAEYERVLARLLGSDADGLLGKILADLRPCQEVLGLVEQAERAGVVTAVLSNSWGTGAFDPYDGYDLDGRFDTVVISDVVGLRKPSLDIYQLCADKMALAPEQCVFVDDTAHNLPPAEQLGMATVLFGDIRAGIAQIRDLLGLG